MSRFNRILFELLAPVPLGALLICVCLGQRSEPLLETILGFPFFVVIAYVFGLVPAGLYTLAMELWFNHQLHQRWGRVWTVILSLAMGAFSGTLICFLSASVTQATLNDYLRFAIMGSLVGLVMECCLAGFRVPDPAKSGA